MRYLYVWEDVNLRGEHGFRALTGGPNPVREFFAEYDEVVAYADRMHFTIFEKSPPEWGYDDALNIGDGHQFRYEPVRTPGVMREGIHAALGVLVALLPFLAFWFAPALLIVGIVSSVVAVVLFMAYEITEGLRIRDWSYRDIGGLLVGYFGCNAVGIIGAAIIG